MTKYHAQVKIGNCSYFTIEITYKVLGIFKFRKREIFIPLPIQDCRKTVLSDIYNLAKIELAKYIDNQSIIEPDFKIASSNIEAYASSDFLKRYV